MQVRVDATRCVQSRGTKNGGSRQSELRTYAQIASQLLLPVPIGGMQEPVLQKAGLGDARLANGPFGDQRDQRQ